MEGQHQQHLCVDELSDLVLLIGNGAAKQELRVLSTLLQIASPILRDVLRIDRDAGLRGSVEHKASPDGLPRLPVEGSYEGWSALIKHLYLPSLTGEASELSPAAAYAIFPIAHAYNMQGMLRSCTRVVAQQACLPFHCPVTWTQPQPQPQPTTATATGAAAAATATTAVAAGAAATVTANGIGVAVGARAAAVGGGGVASTSSSTTTPPPTLLDWLSLADAKQYAPLTQACLGHLSKAESGTSMRSMLAHGSVRERMEQLRQGTLVELLGVAAGFPASFKGLKVPDLSSEPSFMHNAPADSRYRPYGSCIAGPASQPCLLVPLYDSGDIEMINLSDGTSSLLRAHAGHVLEMCGNERLALSGSFDGAVSVWDLATGRQLRGMQRGEEAVWGLCFCGSDGTRAATGLDHGVVRMWDLETGSQLGKDWTGHREAVVSVSASQDGQLLLTGSSDHQLRLWDTRISQGEPGSCVRVLQESGVMGHLDTVRSVCLSADGSVAVSGSFDGSVKVWDMRLSAMCTANMHVPPQQGCSDKGRVWRLCMDPLGTTALSICQERSSLHLWDVSRGTLLATRTWPGELTAGLCASHDLSRVMVSLQGYGGTTATMVQLWQA